MSTEVKRPDVWSKDLGIEVLDPDGWRADGQPWGLAITEQDFRRRAAMSTMREVTTPAPSLLDQDGDDDGREAAPASPDPSKVKAGDTVVLERGTGLARDVVERIDPYPHGGYSIVLRETTPAYLTVTGWMVTDHQPAPEPEPEWKVGTVGTAGTVRGLGYTGPVVRTDEHLLPWWTPALVDGAHYHGEETVTDFVPDEPRPLPTRDELAKAITRGTRRSADATATLHEVNGHAAADRVLDLLRGAS